MSDEERWMREEDITRCMDVYELALSALQTDGAHHKQWYLERIVECCTVNGSLETLHGILDWERGIAP